MSSFNKKSPLHQAVFRAVHSKVGVTSEGLMMATGIDRPTAKSILRMIKKNLNFKAKS